MIGGVTVDLAAGRIACRLLASWGVVHFRTLVTLTLTLSLTLT